MNNLEKERCDHGLSIDDLADILGVHPNTVRGWERGDFEPTGKNLVQLSAALGCTPEHLLGIEPRA